MWSVDGKQFVYVCSFVSAGRAVRARLCLCLIRNTSPHRQPWTSSSGSTPFSCTFWRSFGQHHPRMRSATPVVLGAALRVIAITVVVALYQHLFFSSSSLFCNFIASLSPRRTTTVCVHSIMQRRTDATCGCVHASERVWACACACLWAQVLMCDVCVLDRKITTAVQLKPFCLHFSALHSLCFGKIYTIRRRRLLSASSLFRFCAVHLRHLLSHKAGAAETPLVFACVFVFYCPTRCNGFSCTWWTPRKKGNNKRTWRRTTEKVPLFDCSSSTTANTCILSDARRFWNPLFFRSHFFFPFQILIYITY